MWADPEVVRHISGVPSSREQSWSRILRYSGHWTLLNYGYWLVEERDTGEFVGEVGFSDYHRAIQPSLDGMPELGWVLARHAQGKGYATEAVQASLRWAKTHFAPSTQIASMITAENVASLRVAEKCGFRLRGAGIHRNHLRQVIGSLLHREFTKRQLDVHLHAQRSESHEIEDNFARAR